MWYRLAHELHMPLQACMRSTTSSEFVAWCEYFEDEWNKPDRADYYLAQIACEIRRSQAKHPGSIKLKDFILRFKPKEGKKLTKTQLERKTQQK